MAFFHGSFGPLQKFLFPFSLDFKMLGLYEIFYPLVLGAMLDEVQEKIPSPHVVALIVVVFQHYGVTEVGDLLKGLYRFRNMLKF